MKQSPKVLILILSTKDQRYNDFISACTKTWIKQAQNQKIQCLFYQGGAEEDYLENNTINLAVNDSLSNTSQKLIKAFQFIERECLDYDFIFRTNLSSYIYIENLLNFIYQKQGPDLYSGIVGSYNTSFPFANKFGRLNLIFTKIFRNQILKFASGSGFWISKNNIHRLLNDKSLNFKYIDDVMVGECLSRHNIPILKASRIDLNNNNITYSIDIQNSIDLIKNCYHIRLKSNNRELDVKRFYILNNHHSFPTNCQELVKPTFDNVNQI